MQGNQASLVVVWVAVTMLAAGTGFGIGHDGLANDGSAWDVSFSENAASVGIDFRTAGEIHDPTGNDKDWPAFPEIMGVGACWADLDGDGYEDLYVANQRYNDRNPFARGFNDLFDPTNKLYVNDGNGTFTDRTGQAGVESRTFDSGCSVADYDADGHKDLIVTGFGHVRLYQNDGEGAFTDQTGQAGLDLSGACAPHECWATCSAWADFDRDGWLDLFVCTYVESDMEDLARGPGAHKGQHNLLFKNNGNGTFTEIAASAGVQGIAEDELGSKSLGAVWTDADLDGWLDLYVANDMTPNEFYWNDGDGTFTRDDEAGLFDERAGMGVASGDSSRSGYPDVYITHYESQHNGFYENRGDSTFLDRSGEGDLGNDLDYLGWGTHFVDLDRDGRLDLVAANGHTNWLNDDAYNQETLVFRGEDEPGGGTRWTDMTESTGPGVLEKRVTRGAAFADHDLDGNTDFVLANNANQTLQFLQGAGNANAWLYVQPVQAGPNAEAIGARVVVENDGLVQTREIQAGASYLSQNSLLADFGLGGATSVDRVTVHWPDGHATSVEELPVDRVVRIDRGSGGYVTDTLSPVTRHHLAGEEGVDGWFRSDVTLSLEAEDRAIGPASGLAGTEYRDEQGAWRPHSGSDVPFEDEAAHEFVYRSRDATGNVEPVRRATFGIDLTAPTANHRIDGVPGSNGWWHEADLVLEAEDGLSGIDEVLYRIDGGPWTPYDRPVGLPDGERSIEYKARDRAGNESPPNGTLVRVDATPPDSSVDRPAAGALHLGDGAMIPLATGPAVVVTMPEETGFGGADFEVVATATDATSGIRRVDFFLDAEYVASVHHPGPQYTWSWDTKDYPAGSYLLEAVATDTAGNPAVAKVDVILVPANTP